MACSIYFFGIDIDKVWDPFTGDDILLGWWGFFPTVLWLVALTNLINLIDGVDGLAAGISLMLMGLLAFAEFGTGSLSQCLTIGAAGALIGFLFHNFPPAKVYMGDGGAYFLGFLIGVLTIHNSQKGSVAAALVAPMIALSLPILDVSLAIGRRAIKGLPLFRPDRKHIHHRLLDAGLSHRRTVLVLYGVSLFFLGLAMTILLGKGRVVSTVVGVVFITVVVSARYLGLIEDWFAPGKILGRSLELRKDTRYALALKRWLEMHAEYCRSLEELWGDYLFIVNKLGFYEVRMETLKSRVSWKCNVPEDCGEAGRFPVTPMLRARGSAIDDGGFGVTWQVLGSRIDGCGCYGCFA